MDDTPGIEGIESDGDKVQDKVRVTKKIKGKGKELARTPPQEEESF
jgi:hypothetical protein